MKRLPATFLICSIFVGTAFARMPFPLLEGSSQSSEPTSITAIETEVTRVLDGDTISVTAFSQNVRLASIDAPETKKKNKPGQPFSQAAVTHLNKLLGPPPRHVSLYCYERDHYDRPVCDVIANNKNIGHLMVADGYSWANTASRSRYLRAPELVEAQKNAELKRLGMWNTHVRPIEPWIWRKVCWSQGLCELH